ncbi:GIY-YIG nuclease family protein [Fibrella sp. HMF5335]|uniref:GIY-YIG nuclease family protein n=1 Tax=Fibrella rubiginis TaxID=2817060 RepID=A0A939GFH8_9BACT|nr:GIY-YIG nuclease family protein [Fibrella rubiginis]MBO0937381.1 GIY-YIG nuclease family protein [Fibrella rubiginis]
MNKFYVYILRCADGSYYTDITNDPERRLTEHNEGLDLKAYTYTRRPVQLLWYDVFQTPMAAIEVEKQIKGWSRVKKEALINGRFDLLPGLSKTVKQVD